MCGRYTLVHDPDEVTEQFKAIRENPFERSYNVAPTQSVAVVGARDGARVLRTHRWGLVPSWARDPGIAAKLINARAETVADKPSFRAAFARRRCLVPADGFFEWKPAGRAKVPHYFRRRDGGLFAFAGLWEEWRAPDGSALRTCAIVTVTPNRVVGPVHDRMPAILLPEHEARWLERDADRATLLSLLQPYPDELLEAWVVSPRVNVATANDPACIARVEAA